MKFPPLNFDALTQANYLPSACKSFDYTVTGYIMSPRSNHVQFETEKQLLTFLLWTKIIRKGNTYSRK